MSNELHVHHTQSESSTSYHTLPETQLGSTDTGTQYCLQSPFHSFMKLGFAYTGFSAFQNSKKEERRKGEREGRRRESARGKEGGRRVSWVWVCAVGICIMNKCALSRSVVYACIRVLHHVYNFTRIHELGISIIICTMYMYMCVGYEHCVYTFTHAHTHYTCKYNAHTQHTCTCIHDATHFTMWSAAVGLGGFITPALPVTAGCEWRLLALLYCLGEAGVCW